MQVNPTASSGHEHRHSCRHLDVLLLPPWLHNSRYCQDAEQMVFKPRQIVKHICTPVHTQAPTEVWRMPSTDATLMHAAAHPKAHQSYPCLRNCQAHSRLCLPPCKRLCPLLNAAAGRRWSSMQLSIATTVKSPAATTVVLPTG
jgi:hypothetical protein